MRAIKKLKQFLTAARKEFSWYNLLLDGDEWVNEEWYSTDLCNFCRTGCVYSENFTDGGNEGVCLNCGQDVYWDEDKEKWCKI
jgi:hypothetical protein